MATSQNRIPMKIGIAMSMEPVSHKNRPNSASLPKTARQIAPMSRNVE